MNTTHEYNFKTKESETHSGPLTEEKALSYIPQNEACQQLFKLFRQSGKSIEDALIEVLSAFIGDKK